MLVTRFPTDIEGWDRLQRIDEAAEAYERALILEPRSPALLNSLGGIESARGRHAAAIAHQSILRVRAAPIRIRGTRGRRRLLLDLASR